MKKILFTVMLVLMIFIYAFCVNEDLSGSLVRFHVIANSDSDSDQNLKLKVRDAVIKEADIITKGASTKQEAVAALCSSKQELKETAEKTVRENGYKYDVDVEYGNFFFPEKEYDNIALPAGRYDAMRVKIGEAKGKNWWCVMFPPLCISEDSVGELDEDALEYLKASLSEEEYEMITSSDEPPVIVKFRVVDMVMKIAEYFRS